ncbi:hypothetical protein ACFUMH_10925 [Cellulomonas sp. NPDC057328]|uniref:hypothetical protein n=1 Tax=Cellulomonas sp. NPDC057328 TaxID=3346101 RepID=UPI003631AB5A
MPLRTTDGDDELVVAGFVVSVPTAPPPGVEGVAPDCFVTVSPHLHDAPTPEWWDWFTEPAEAEACRASAGPQGRVLTVAMRRGDADTLMREHGGAAQPYYALLRDGVPAAHGAVVLGHEVVGVEAFSFHSWHCYGYAAQVRVTLGVEVNDLGLLDRYDDAVRVRDWMLARPPTEQPPPVPWIVLTLVEGTAAFVEPGE